MKTVIRMLTPDAQDRRELRNLAGSIADSAKMGCRMFATVALLGLVACMSTSLCGMFIAGDVTDKGMTVIWGK